MGQAFAKQRQATGVPNPERLNRWLTRVCALLVLFDLLPLALGVASIPRFYQRVTTLTIPAYGVGVGNALSNDAVLTGAAARGMSLPAFARYYLGIDLLASLIFTTVGALVLWRARAHWFGWFTAHVMLFLNSYAFYTPAQVALLLPAAVIDLGSVLWPTYLLYFFLFPNGRIVPRWMSIPVLLYAVAHVTLQLFGALAQAGLLPGALFAAVLGPAQTFIVLMFALLLACQIYRYARVSSRVERAQTRWVILGLAVLVLLPALGAAVGLDRVFATFEWGALSLTIAPITLAIAILRYRLWDIDVIIRRTLQYTVLTGLLALIYAGGVVTLQAIFSSLTGRGDSPVVTVITTLTIAALFHPLRARVRALIDRRFYRQKFNADETLSQFAATVRREVDIERLSGALLGVVAETMQPERVTIWLKTEASPVSDRRPPGHGGNG